MKEIDDNVYGKLVKHYYDHIDKLDSRNRRGELFPANRWIASLSEIEFENLVLMFTL